MTTMNDVARAAGVAGSTVSHVLNGTRQVNRETRRRVEEAIITTGYRRNSIARSLAAGRTEMIGFTVPLGTNAYIADIANAVEGAAAAAGYTLMFTDTKDDPEVEHRAIERFLEHRVDGIIMAPGPSDDHAAITRIRRERTPLVLIDRAVPGVNCDQVTVDNEDSAYKLTRHLLSHGYRELAVVLGKPGIWPTDQRRAGFERALAESDLPREPQLFVMGEADEQITEEAILQLYESGRSPEAIVTLNNAMTLGTMRALRHLDLEVPDDVALGSFDDFSWADLFQPRLTAIAQDATGIGRIAIELLIEQIADPARSPRHVELATTFNVRDSCGPHDRSSTDTAGRGADAA
jgi:LacI family transcriptional regulator